MSVIHEIEQGFKKKHIVDVRSGDTVRVHQKIREGNKERVQVFEGLVIRTDRPNSHTASITVRRIASGIGVEKTYLLHSPLVVKVEVTKRSKVRRNYLSYMRSRTGKAARLSSVDFDRNAVNAIPDVENDIEEKPAKTDQPTVADEASAEAKDSEEKSAEKTPAAEKPEDKLEKSAEPKTKADDKSKESAKDEKVDSPKDSKKDANEKSA